MKNPRRNSQLAWRSIGPDTLIVDTRINKEVHRLNETGQILWNLCDGEHNLDDLALALKNEFDIELEEALLDVNSFLEDLNKRGLLE